MPDSLIIIWCSRMVCVVLNQMVLIALFLFAARKIPKCKLIFPGSIVFNFLHLKFVFHSFDLLFNFITGMLNEMA